MTQKQNQYAWILLDGNFNIKVLSVDEGGWYFIQYQISLVVTGTVTNYPITNE